MEEGKYWWQSVVFRAGVSAVILGCVQVYSAVTGAEVDIDALRGVVDNGLGLILGAFTTYVGFRVIFGRVKAMLPIKKNVVPPLPWRKDQPTEKE